MELQCVSAFGFGSRRKGVLIVIITQVSDNCGEFLVYRNRSQMSRAFVSKLTVVQQADRL